MNEEEIKKIAQEEMNRAIMKNLDSSIIFKYISNLEQEDIKKDLIINKMAEQLTTPYHSKEWVIDYYKREIEK